MSDTDTQLFINPRGQIDHAYGPAQRAILNRDDFETARTEISSWPGYTPTPLLELPGLATATEVGDLRCKHEGYRFGIGSFKPTGPTYAMLRVLKAEVLKATGAHVSTRDLIDGRYEQVTRRIVVCATTSGNHGRALAWGARMFRCRAVLYMNDGVSAGRAKAIASYGGEVVRVAGAYHQAAARMYEEAETAGYIVVGDPGTPPYPHVSRDIMQGYALTVDELMTQYGPLPPTHIFVPGGGGILAGACCGHLWEAFGSARPRLIVVEPTASCCLYESARGGQHVTVPAAASVMDGLLVEEPATDALDLLLASAFAFLTVPEQAAVEAMCQAARPVADDPPTVIGDTGSAAWAGFLVATADGDLRQALQLDEQSRVTIIVTETATDPVVYEQLTGIDPSQIAGYRN